MRKICVCIQAWHVGFEIFIHYMWSDSKDKKIKKSEEHSTHIAKLKFRKPNDQFLFFFLALKIECNIEYWSFYFISFSDSTTWVPTQAFGNGL